MPHRVLVIEPEASERFPVDIPAARLPAEVRRERWGAFSAGSPLAARADLVVAVSAAGSAAMAAVLDWASAHDTAAPVLGVLPRNAPDAILRAAAQALDDFVLWPAEPSELDCRILRLLPATVARETAERAVDPALRSLVGESESFRRAVDRIPSLARADVPVLILGETGTGKELAARAIHESSRRRAGPFVPVDCSALPDTLFENEMFGHERGAFTDAHCRREGLVGLAEKGTLFLDEIDSLALGVQAKLLRLLQEKTYRPLGSDRFRTADVRILAASNRDLAEAVRLGRLRADLFFRLDVLRLRLPPLRERAADAVLLAERFLRDLGPGRTLSPAAARKIAAHRWPGNVRELWTVVQRAWVSAEGPRILASDVELPGRVCEPVDPERPFKDARGAAVAEFESRYVAELLRRHGGNVTRAARAAGAERRAFGRLARKYGLRPPRGSAEAVDETAVSGG